MEVGLTPHIGRGLATVDSSARPFEREKLAAVFRFHTFCFTWSLSLLSSCSFRFLPRLASLKVQRDIPCGLNTCPRPCFFANTGCVRFTHSGQMEVLQHLSKEDLTEGETSSLHNAQSFRLSMLDSTHPSAKLFSLLVLVPLLLLFCRLCSRNGWITQVAAVKHGFLSCRVLWVPRRQPCADGAFIWALRLQCCCYGLWREPCCGHRRKLQLPHLRFGGGH